MSWKAAGVSSVATTIRMCAISDAYLVIAAARTGSLFIFFTVEDGESLPGSFRFKMEQPEVIKLTLFSDAELAVLSKFSAIKKQKIWKFYSLPSLARSGQRFSASSVLEPRIGNEVQIETEYPVKINCDQANCLFYTRDARFSSDEQKLARWSQSWWKTKRFKRSGIGAKFVISSLKTWDEDFLGFPGISLSIPFNCV